MLSILYNGDAEVVSTIENYVYVGWTYYGTVALKEYRISEDSTFSGVAWSTWSADDGGQYRHDFSSGKGKKTIYVQLKNVNDEVTESFGKEIEWMFRTAKVGINTNTYSNVLGTYDSATGIHNLRMRTYLNTEYTIRDTMGAEFGTIAVDRTKMVYNGNGIAPEESLRVYPEVVYTNNEECMATFKTSTYDPDTTFTVKVPAGRYNLRIFANSNRAVTDTARLTLATPYFKFTANGIKASAVNLKNNVDQLVEIDNIDATTGIITLVMGWDKSITTDLPDMLNMAGDVYGAINMLIIQETA